MDSSSHEIDISVVIPVLGEGDRIRDCICHVKGIGTGHPHEIIVVDGDRGGSTVRGIADTEGVTAMTAPRGRAHQMNAGAGRASGRILLFLHADTLLPDNAFGAIKEAVDREGFEAGAFSLGLDSRRLSMRVIEGAARFRIFLTGIPFGDQGIFFLRRYFNDIGGYAPIPIMEDMEIMRRARKQGGKIRILPSRIITSVRKWEDDGILYSVFRNWSIQILYTLGVSPERLVRIYYRDWNANVSSDN